jgi:hypothetical protein
MLSNISDENFQFCQAKEIKEDNFELKGPKNQIWWIVGISPLYQPLEQEA